MERSSRQEEVFLTYFTHYEYGFHQKTLGSSSQEEVPKEFALATDDEWVIDEANMELIRVHKQMRKALYCRGPGSQGWTHPIADSIGVGNLCFVVTWTPSARRLWSEFQVRARASSGEGR